MPTAAIITVVIITPLQLCVCTCCLLLLLSVNADMTHRGSIERRKKKGQGKGDKPRLDPWRRDHGSLWDTHTLSPLLSSPFIPYFLLNSLPCDY
ncbi:hypothetical protein BKA57DRAFT_465039 [Linnemannia elongata]|nr:hypothetical protein BKA57DRAFT_465039 [Linnemannia elongata]